MNVLQKITDVLHGKLKLVESRAPSWQKAKNIWLRANPKCAACGSTSKVEVHHKIPFHISPDLELNPNNFITLCESSKYGLNCHLLIGHLGDYRSYNPTVDTDAVQWQLKLSNRPKEGE